MPPPLTLDPMDAAPDPLPPDPALRRLAAAYTAYRPDVPASLDALFACYATGARFRDPFNEVVGVDAIRRIFEHMPSQVDDARFEVVDGARHDRLAYLGWVMHYRPRGAGPAAPARRIEGCTRLRFDAEDRIVEHLDFWDPASQLYESVPVLGAVLRALRRRLAAPHG